MSIEFVIYDTDWFGLKRLDFESCIHAVPEGTREEWLEVLDYLYGENPESPEFKRLAAEMSGDGREVTLHSPRNAGYMAGPPDRDYLTVPVEWLIEQIHMNLVP